MHRLRLLYCVLEIEKSPIYLPFGPSILTEVDLNIKTFNQEDEPLNNVDLDFANGDPYRSDQVAGNEVQVNITWHPEVN